MSKRIKCPTCQKELSWDSSNPFRPFCSERCRLIDLGEWASEGHRISGDPGMPEEDFPDMGHTTDPDLH